MEFRYQDLEVSKLVLLLINQVYGLLNKFPTEEKWVLVGQIMRAVNSIYLNLAEGSARKSKKDFARFLTIALGSLAETHAGLHLGFKRGYINYEDFQSVQPLIEKIWFKLCALRDSQLLIKN
ncbi:MAG: four helix bundle protein [Candidatus Uhrbacteria bacterium]